MDQVKILYTRFQAKCAPYIDTMYTVYEISMVIMILCAFILVFLAAQQVDKRHKMELNKATLAFETSQNLFQECVTLQNIRENVHEKNHDECREYDPDRESDTIYTFGEHVIKYKDQFTKIQSQTLCRQFQDLFDKKPDYWNISLRWASAIGKLGEAYRLFSSTCS